MRPSRSIIGIVLAALAAVTALAVLLPEVTDRGRSGDATPPAGEGGPAGARPGDEATARRPGERSRGVMTTRRPGERSRDAAATRRPGERSRGMPSRVAGLPWFQIPDGAFPVVRVRPGRRVAIRTKPGGGKVADVAGGRTEFGSPTVFGVIDTAGEWAAVSTPALPNGKLGWVRLDRRKLRAAWTRLSVAVSLGERRAVLREGDAELRSFPVTIGAPGTETPVGRFAVTDTFRGGLNPAYGCCAVAISAIQPRLPSGWLGGNRIAIHGNGSGEPLGLAGSNGCMRAADRHVRTLVDALPLGTPVFVRR